MIKQRKAICIFLAIVGIFISLATAKTLGRSLKVSLLEKRVQDLNFSGLSLIFYMSITNSSSKPAYLVRYDYRFEVNGKGYLNLLTNLEEDMKIGGKETIVISLPIKITYDLLFQAIEGIEKEDKAVCYIAGGLTFSDGKKTIERIPFAFSGDFPILKQPEIEFIAFEVKDLTIGGADLVFKVLFKNKNGFELLVDKLSYSIELGEIPIDQGVVRGDKNIEGNGRKIFTFPFLFSFFEIGKEVYDILRKPSSVCRFSGEAEVRTAWGRLKIPFEKTEIITFSKTS